MQKIAVIPARGGSKRIPGKNIKLFRGLPMISYSIRAAIDSGLFDSVVVSTDSEEIAEVSRQYGAVVPFVRNPTLADDLTGTLPVIQDSIMQLQANGYTPSLVACIYPTAPLLRGIDLKEAYASYERSGSDCFLVSAKPFECPVQRGFLWMDGGELEMLFPEHYSTRSQDLPIVYHDAGSFYFASARCWLQASRIYQKTAQIWVVDPHRSVDIDTPNDWAKAELKADFHQFLNTRKEASGNV